MEVIMDTKEPKEKRNIIKLSLQEAEIAVREESLEVGDFAITTLDPKGNKSVLALFERKTYADQYSSIMDGRYRSQRENLLTCEVPVVGYIYVGSPLDIGYNRRIQDPDKAQEILISSVVHTAIMKQGRLCTISIPDDSWMPHVLKKLCIYLIEETVSSSTEKITSLNKKRSRDKKSIFSAQIACIPGLDTKAELVTNVYHSMVELMDALSKEGPQAVEKIPGIGKILSKSIYETLCDPLHEEDKEPKSDMRNGNTSGNKKKKNVEITLQNLVRERSNPDELRAKRKKTRTLN